MAARRTGDAAPPGLVCVGVVTGARGIRGEVRIKSFTAAPADVAAYGPVRDETGETVLRLAVSGVVKGQVIARVEGVADRNGAEALAGLRLYVDRSALPEPDDDEYYHADLVGLAAETTDGSPLGRIAAVHDFGAGTVLELEVSDGRPGGGLMVPFTRASVPVVDVAGGRLVVELPAEDDSGPER